MLRKVGITTALLLALPVFANAWTLTAKVGSGFGSITSDRAAGKVDKTASAPVIGYFKTSTNTDAADAAQVLTLVPQDGYRVSSIIVDGLQQPVGTTVRVPMGPQARNHSVVVYYTAKLSSLTVVPASGGVVSVQRVDANNKAYGAIFRPSTLVPALTGLKPGTSLKVTAAPNSDFKVASIGGSAEDSGLQGDIVSKFITLSNDPDAANSITAVFTLVPQVAARLAASSLDVAVNDTVTLDATKSSANGAISYSYVASPAATAVITQNGSATATAKFTAPGTYVVTLTATSGAGGISTSAATIVVKSANAYNSNICFSCHSGRTPTVVANYNKSTHNTSSHSTATCNSCHDALKPKHPGTGLLDIAKDGKTDACAKCHLDRRGQFPGAENYSIYSSASMLVLKAPHGGGKAAPSAGAVNVGDSITQYVTQGAICNDCHTHDNTINKGFAESGHGKVSSEPLNALTHYDWSARANNGTRQNGNCDRCHTAVGFIKFAGQDPAMQARLALQPGKANNVLICVSCHSDIETGALRTDATPPGNPTKLTGGYFALFSTAGTAVAPGKTKIQIGFPGYKNSSICIPCHSGRSTAAVFTAVIDQAKLVNKNYTTIQTSYYQHAANMGQTFLGQGAYDFTGARVAAANSHANVMNGSSDTQGPCVGCHYNKSGATHSLEVANFDVCASCHRAGFGSADLAAAEEKFEAGVKVLQALVTQKMEPLRTDSSKPISEERVFVRFAQLNRVAADNTTDKVATRAKHGYGAWYNWQLLVTYDKAAFAHNPGYAKQILFDTIDYLDDGSINNSAEATIAASTAITDTEKTAAAEYFQAPCATCHATVTEKVQEGKHAYEVSTHSGSCGRCHTTEGYVAYAATSPDFNTVISASYNGGSNVSCAACHDSHGTLRNVSNANFNPTINAGTADASDQFKLCTSCHNLVNNNGVPVASGLVVSGTTTVAKQQHAKDWYRNIASTHYDLTTTGVGQSSTVIEGYNVRYNKNSACTDCHGHELYTNTNGVIAVVPTEGTVHTEWAQSGHAGGLLKAKFAAFTTANPTRARNTANAAAVMAAGVTGASGAAWEHYDWDNSTGTSADRKGCQKCHTATGSANYLNNPATYNPVNNDFSHLTKWATAKTSPQNEVLYCWGCHKDAGTGELRNPGAITTSDYKFKGASAVYPDVTASNVCITCHGGQASGETITALTTAGNTFSNVSFVNSHYMAAAGLMYAKVGYTNFIDPNTAIGTSTYGKSVTSDADGGALTSTHRKLGTPAMATDSHVGGQGMVIDGPCVTCHYAKGKHDLEIGAVAFTEVCVKCHTAEGTTTLTAENFKEVFLEEQSVPFKDALALALNKLATYGITYNKAAYPYFYDANNGNSAVKDWTRGGTLTAAQAEKLMGACFNINLLTRDPAAYVHARSYTRRLIYDTIDFLDDKQINMSVGATAVAYDAVKYVKGASAAEATEDFKYLAGYNRNSNAWNALERP